MIVKERYCSFEVSKLLREKSFDEPIYEFYNSSGTILYARNKDGFKLSELNGYGVYYPHITHQMAMDWLREIHKLHIGIVRGPKGYHITIETIPLGVVKYITREIVGTTYVESFKDAVDAALEFCLTKLI